MFGLFKTNTPGQAISELPPAQKWPQNRIRVLPGAAANLRRYAVTRPTGRNKDDEYVCAHSAKIQNDGYWREYRNFTDQTLKANRALFELVGVTEIQVMESELIVKIGAAYDFEGVHKEIMSIIREVFFEGEYFDIVEVDDQTLAEDQRLPDDRAKTRQPSTPTKTPARE